MSVTAAVAGFVILVGTAINDNNEVIHVQNLAKFDNIAKCRMFLNEPTTEASFFDALQKLDTVKEMHLHCIKIEKPDLKVGKGL